VWLTLAICGLAVLAQTFHVIFLGVKWAGVAYLLLLALKMWTSPAVASAVMPDRRREIPKSLFFGGLALSTGNPKVMIFYVAFLPTMMDITSISVLGYVILVFATLGVLTLVFGIYVVLATPRAAFIYQLKGFADRQSQFSYRYDRRRCVGCFAVTSVRFLYGSERRAVTCAVAQVSRELLPVYRS
jgi:threonine/homoserine/homoserine lactone efflux protein